MGIWLFITGIGVALGLLVIYDKQFEKKDKLKEPH